MLCFAVKQSLDNLADGAIYKKCRKLLNSLHFWYVVLCFLNHNLSNFLYVCLWIELKPDNIIQHTIAVAIVVIDLTIVLELCGAIRGKIHTVNIRTANFSDVLLVRRTYTTTISLIVGKQNDSVISCMLVTNQVES